MSRRRAKNWCKWCGETLRSGEFCGDLCAEAYAEDLRREQLRRRRVG